MSLTLLRNEIRRLVKIRPTQDAVDYALALVEIEVDALQGSREATEKDLISWFLAHATIKDEAVEHHWNMIAAHLFYLSTRPVPVLPLWGSREG